MGNYVPSQQSEVEFDGDLIKVTVEPMTQEDFLKLLPHFKVGDDGKNVFQMSEGTDYLALSDKLLKKYVTSFEGLTDANKNPVDLSTVLKSIYFMNLRRKLMGLLFDAATIQADDEKKSGEQSEQS